MPDIVVQESGGGGRLMPDIVVQESGGGGRLMPDIVVQESGGGGRLMPDIVVQETREDDMSEERQQGQLAMQEQKTDMQQDRVSELMREIHEEVCEGEERKTPERLQKQMDFFLKADGEKLITRQTYIGGGSRKETDAEHAWSLALGVILFSEYANEKIDQLKTIKMVLIHDIVEIEAGDSYAYDYAAQATAHEREAKAAEDLFGMLPEDQGAELKALWEEFEAYETPEAKFAHTMDNFQPLQLNDATGGKSWVEHSARLSDVLRRNRKTGEGAYAIWEYMRKLIAGNVRDGNLRDC